MSVNKVRCWLLVVVLAVSGVMPVAAGTQTSAHPTAAASKVAGLLDLNTATAAQLKALPGIGEAYSKRMLDGRPYTSKNQLVSKGILPQSAYDKIKDSVVARRVSK